MVTTQREVIAMLVNWHAPVLKLPPTGIYTGVCPTERVKRATFACHDLAREASDRLGLTAPARRSAVVKAVADTAWENCPHTAHGRRRRWFETDEMVEAILRAASGCTHPDHVGMESCLHRHAHG